MRLPSFSPAARNAVSDRSAMLSLLGFWAVWLALVTGRAAAMGWADQGGMLGRRLGMTAVGLGLGWMVHQALSRLALARLLGRATATFALCAAAATVFAVLNTLVFYAWFPVPSVAADLARWGPRATIITAIADGVVTWSFFFGAWGAFHLALAHVGEVREAERRAGRARAEAQEARLAMLRLQVDPHFLFNALNALASLVTQQRTAAAAAMVADLAAFFRAGLELDPAADIPLADELELQRLYLAVERARFGDRLDVRIEEAPAAAAARLPALLLQPLVENAIKHGLARSMAPVAIRITVRHEAGRVVIAVRNSASGPAGAPAPVSTGVGLANVRARLATRFGGGASLRAEPEGDGWISEVALPLSPTPAHA